jgi:hypothetical protein
MILQVSGVDSSRSRAIAKLKSKADPELLRESLFDAIKNRSRREAGSVTRRSRA